MADTLGDDGLVGAAQAQPAAIGRFVLVRKLGSGGMGEVWLAEDARLRRRVALKLLKGGNDEEIERFKREAVVSGRLNHQDIAAVYEAGCENGRHYIAMQYVDGWTLKDWPNTNMRTVVKVVGAIARALAFAHDRSVIHRDVKPENIMVERGDRKLRAYLMDFGLARQVGDGSVSGIAGTPSYMSPEQVRGQRLDRRTDIWSLGATLYELLVGTNPFRATGALATMKRVEELDPEPLHEAVPGVDQDLSAIVMMCLEKDRSKRYAGADLLADDLEAWLRRKPVSARPVGPFGRITRAVRRRPVIAVLSVTMVVSLFSAAAAGVWAKMNADARRSAELAAEVRYRQALDAEESARRERERLRQLEEVARREREGKERVSGAEREARTKLLLDDAANMAADGRYGEASDNARRALAENAKNQRAWATLGYCTLMLGEVKEALACLDKAIEMDPSDWRSLSNRAFAHDKLGNRKETLRDLEETLRLMPPDAQERAALEAAARHMRTQDDQQ
jgi:tetratricopeptide (TPR) repeat protein